jgi:hypothetical protein
VSQATPSVNVTSSTSITTAQDLNVKIAVSGGSGTPMATGTVTLASGSYSSAAQALSGGSATIDVPAGALDLGTDTLTASYSGDANYTVNTGAAQVSVTAPPPPGLQISGGALTISPGATTANTSTITVTPIAGFTGSVILTAAITSSPTGAVELPTLSFGSTSPVSITGVSAATATLTVSTSPVTRSALSRRRGWRALLGLFIFLALLTGGVLSCGGGGISNPGTTAGDYTVTVTGTSGTLTAQTTVSIHVL